MKKTIITIILTTFSVIGIELLVTKFFISDKKTKVVKEYRKSGYKFINPVLDYYEIEPVVVKDVRQLQRDVSIYVNKEIEQGNIKMISVYYRDLNNGPWIGINEDEHYAPASLLKVPVMIALLKKSEDDADFLNKKIVFTPQGKNKRRSITDKDTLIPNKEYTIQQLMETMIIHSDNDAVNILQKSVKNNYLHDIYYDLGIAIDSVKDNNFISVKDYAAYFRILYNATYLTKKNSEAALKILTQSTFKDGIVAGVPENTTVAHKFGERFFPSDTILQLHECAIVYKPNKPYLLCIMTRGTEITKMTKIIADISSIVYKSNATKDQ